MLIQVDKEYYLPKSIETDVSKGGEEYYYVELDEEYKSVREGWLVVVSDWWW